MRQRISFAALCLAVAASTGTAGTASAKGEQKDVPDDRALDAETVLGDAVSYENLTLIPVLAVKPTNEKREYTVLDEAFDKKKVKIKEKDDEQVNELTLTNDSDQALFVMA